MSFLASRKTHGKSVRSDKSIEREVSHTPPSPKPITGGSHGSDHNQTS